MSITFYILGYLAGSANRCVHASLQNTTFYLWVLRSDS